MIDCMQSIALVPFIAYFQHFGFCLTVLLTSYSNFAPLRETYRFIAQSPNIFIDALMRIPRLTFPDEILSSDNVIAVTYILETRVDEANDSSPRNVTIFSRRL